MASPLLSLFTGRASTRAVEIVAPQRTFSDVVLPPETRRTLDEALGQVRNHSLIFTRWGLGERHASGLGLAFNFAIRREPGRPFARRPSQTHSAGSALIAALIALGIVLLTR